jgi:DNA-binding XRE family transcriptional regulator
MSRHDLVLASGVHEHTILRIETAQTSNPAWQTIAALAATIDLDLNALARPGIKKGPRLEEPGA